jgi:trans-2,3-dihydro-3-hydroxyanthranilate isomerase
MPTSYDFVQLDVFTRMPLAGNPLAIFTDTRGLTDKQMQALAREMNLSETTLILPREPELEATDGTRVRIFTTREELPFAGCIDTGSRALGSLGYLLAQLARYRAQLHPT